MKITILVLLLKFKKGSTGQLIKVTFFLNKSRANVSLLIMFDNISVDNYMQDVNKCLLEIILENQHEKKRTLTILTISQNVKLSFFSLFFCLVVSGKVDTKVINE
jgi:hypothetical protein